MKLPPFKAYSACFVSSRKGAEQLSVGGVGNYDFILTLAAGSRDQDIVTDFASGDQIEIALSSENNTLETVENTDADKLEKLLELVEITTASNADRGHASATNATAANDTLVTFTNGTLDTNDDAVVMVLEDYATDLNYADFVIADFVIQEI